MEFLTMNRQLHMILCSVNLFIHFKCTNLEFTSITEEQHFFFALDTQKYEIDKINHQQFLWIPIEFKSIAQRRFSCVGACVSFKLSDNTLKKKN